MSGSRWYRNPTAHGLHQVITGVHSNAGEDNTVQAVTDAVVASAGFGVAVVSVLRPDGVMETVAVAGSEDAKGELLGLRRSRRVYDEEFDVADRWGNLLFVPHQRLPNADQRGWIPGTAGNGRRRSGRSWRRVWHPLDALYAPLRSPTGEFLGVLSVDLPVNRTRPGRRQRELLEILAVQAGIAIDNARMAERLGAGEKLFRWAFDGAGTGMALISTAEGNYGRYVRVNPAFAHIVGRSAEEILTMTAQELTHPEDRDEDEQHLRALFAGSQQSYQRDKRYLKGDGTPVWVSVTVAFAGSPDGSAQYAIGQVQDITERRAQQQDLFHRASHDPLTDLPNRIELTGRLQQAISAAVRTGRPGAVLFVDLDGFKDVNDQHGHLIGDQALTVVAARLAAAVRLGDMVVRLGGDEFLIVTDDLTSAGAGELADRLARAVAAPITLPGSDTLTLTVSIGHTPIAPEYSDPNELIAAADHAMYTAKHSKPTHRRRAPGD
jgi:diguanylate cyclase (GGDEF)-like protein/PAS domain S-box-containing protein